MTAKNIPENFKDDIAYVAGQLASRCNTGTGFISHNVATVLVEQYLDEIATIVWEDADHDKWNDDDVLLAIQEVIKSHLKIET